jgi:uncharacterized protein with FMN-binding domain
MSRTRIIILQLKEIVYTAIFVGFGILLLVLLFFMFWPDKEKSSETSENNVTENETSADSPKYVAGVYTREIALGDSTINLQVSIDTDQVKAVELVNLEDSVETMYPLIKPAVQEISEQLAANVSPEEVVLSDDSPYTSQLILDTVSDILDKASTK